MIKPLSKFSFKVRENEVIILGKIIKIFSHFARCTTGKRHRLDVSSKIYRLVAVGVVIQCSNITLPSSKIYHIVQVFPHHRQNVCTFVSERYNNNQGSNIGRYG